MKLRTVKYYFLIQNIIKQKINIFIYSYRLYGRLQGALSFACILHFIISPLGSITYAVQDHTPDQKLMEIGVATIDITPDGPIRLGGYASRESESEGVAQRIHAKALAFGSDIQGPSVLITIDLLGIPEHITKEVAKRLSDKVELDPVQLAISASHTHTGPLVGLSLTSYGEYLPDEHLGQINQYLDKLPFKLVQVALEALQARRPSLVDWGQGEVTFAVNRRVITDGKWSGMGPVPDGAIDHSLPLLRVSDPDGSLRAVLINYACHATTLESDFNRFHGDWPGEAQRKIEDRHPGVTALVAIGAGGDANPQPRGDLSYVRQHGEEIADEVDRLLGSSLSPLTATPLGRSMHIDLPFAHVPSVMELVQLAAEDQGRIGHYAQRMLDRLARGEVIPPKVSYPIQTWTFGEELAMVFLAGEVVVDYALRLKDSLGSDRVWVNAYSNAAPGYIASSRVISEGGFEAELAMYTYDKPGRFVRQIEDMIISTVYNLLPPSFLK